MHTSPSTHGDVSGNTRRATSRRRRRVYTSFTEGRADALYAPYVDRQNREWETVRGDSLVRLPADFEFGCVPGLSHEMAERLRLAGPETLDQASRIAGVTPAALSALYLAANRRAA